MRLRRGRHTLRAALAAGAALGVLAGGAGGAHADGGGLPEYRTAEDAKPVEGADNSAEGPSIEPGGVYTDTVGRGGEKWYSLELDGKSGYFVSATLAPKPGTKVEPYKDGLTVTLRSTDGTECSSTDSVGFRGKDSHPLTDYATRRIGADLDCQEAGPYNFVVEREGEATSDPGDWPVEITVMREPGLEGEVPQEPEEDELPEETPAPKAAGEKKQVQGGTGFNDAGVVGAGRWGDTIRPGETRYYRVPLDWGQRLNTRVELGSSPNADEAGTTYVPGALGVRLYNTARGVVSDESFSSYQETAATAGVYTAPAAYANRYGDDTAVAGMRFAGWYYLAVTMSNEMEELFPEGAPLTLRVDVEGEPTAGPAYDGDAEAAGFGVSEEALGQGGGTLLRIVGFGGVGVGTVLLVGLGAWWLSARRRTATPATAGAVPAQDGATREQGFVQGGFGPPSSGWK